MQVEEEPKSESETADDASTRHNSKSRDIAFAKDDQTKRSPWSEVFSAFLMLQDMGMSAVGEVAFVR